MNDEGCWWENCPHKGTATLQVTINEECENCRKNHSNNVKLCAEHREFLMQLHAATNLARFATGAVPPFQRIRRI